MLVNCIVVAPQKLRIIRTLLQATRDEVTRIPDHDRMVMGVISESGVLNTLMPSSSILLNIRLAIVSIIIIERLKYLPPVMHSI